MGFYSSLHSFAAPIFKFLYRVKICNPENELPSGKCIICANHTSALDPAVIAISLKTPITFFAKASLFKIPLLRGFMKKIGVIPIKRGQNDIVALKNLISALNDEKTCCIFPQGTRIPYADPSETEVKGGMGMVAWYTKAPIMPIFIQTKRRRLKIFRRTYVIMGKPIYFDELPFTDGRFHDFQNVSEYVFKKTCMLEDMSYFEKTAKKE